MEKRRWWVTLGTALLMIGVIAAGDKIGHDNEIQTEVEVVQYWKESDSVLATTGEQGGLFTFQMPQSGDVATGADLTRCGTLLCITGGGGMADELSNAISQCKGSRVYRNEGRFCQNVF